MCKYSLKGKCDRAISSVINASGHVIRYFGGYKFQDSYDNLSKKVVLLPHSP